MNPIGRLLLALLMSVSVWAQSETKVESATIGGESKAGPDLKQGLLHWWPDPAEGTDEVTGRKGVRRGFGPVEENPDVRFGYTAGWVELGPGITNQTFTLSGWMLQPIQQFGAAGHPIIAQGSGFQTGWAFRAHRTNTVEFASIAMLQRDAELNKTVSAGWHAFAIRASPSQTELWMDGDLIETRPGEVSRMPSAEPELLTVGNTILGSNPWDCDLRDLRLHGRRLSNDEIQSLAASPKSQRRDLPAAPTPVLWNSVTPIPANPSHYSLRHFTTDHGLLRSSIQCLHQARNGALWLGAEEGIARFNGRSFWTADQSSPAFSITEADVGAIGEGSFGTLWLGMFHGLVRRQGEEWRAYTNMGPARFVRRLLPAKDGSVWLAGFRDSAPRGPMRLRRFDPVANDLRVDVAIPGQPRDLRLAPDGVWIGTDEPAAVWHFRESTGSVELVAHLATIGNPSPSLAYPPSPCVRLARGSTEGGLSAEVWQEADGPFQWAQIRLETNGPTLTWTRSNRADHDWKMVESSSDASLRDWVPTPQGLLHYDQGRWKRLLLGGANDQAAITALAPNVEGGVWVATKGDGLWLVQPHLIRMLTPSEGWGTEEVHSLVRLRDGRLLVGGVSNTLARIDPRSLLSPEESLFRRGSLVTEQSDGTVIRIAAPNGNDGVFREQGSNQWSYDFIAHGRKVTSPEVSQLLAPADGSVWITDEKGVFHIPRLPELPGTIPGMHLEPPAYTVFLNTLPQHVFLHGLTEAPDGGIWVGSSGAGLFRIFQGQVENFPAPDLLTGNPCIPLGFATDGTLWLGSESGLGVWREGRYRWLRATNGLPESVVCDVEEAEGYLWLAGKRGIHGIPRKDVEAFLAGETNRVSYVSLGRSDGLASTETHLKLQPVMAKTDDGQVWVGTARGVAHFHPREVLDRVRPPPITIEGLKANGRPVTLGIKRLILPPDAARAVEIAFNSLSFVAPERVTFQYHLVGPGSEVTTETAQPYAVFPHLRHGRHVFTVQARSGNGLVSDPGARLEFDIEPYFHQTPLFYGALGFAGLASVAGLVFVRVRVNERKITRTHERKITSVRAGIARDVHDRLGAGLVRLAWQNGREDTPAAAESTTPAQQAARELLRSLDEAVWAINPSKDHLKGVVNYVGSWLRSYFAESPPTLSLDLPAQVPDHPVPAEWRHHVLMIVREACANVLKHARATRIEVAVSLDRNPGSLTLLIRDDGIGFNPAADPAPGKTGGNGLHHLQERAVSLNARLDFRSTPGSGTEIALVVPLPPA